MSGSFQLDSSLSFGFSGLFTNVCQLYRFIILGRQSRMFPFLTSKDNFL